MFTPLLLRILVFVSIFCFKHNITLVISSGVRHHDSYSESLTHAEGRAVDLSLSRKWGWNKKLRSQFEIGINKRFKIIGAVSEDGISRPIIRHNVGLGDHFHIQVRRDLLGR